jgi:phosphoribosylglycinamide formyltransferase-1
VLTQEHRLYPAAVRLLCEGRVRLHDGRVLLDGQPLAQPLQLEPAN